MNELRIGSLFTGYGGLDMAVRAALGGATRTVWHSDIKPASIALLRHRHPDVPNLGNLRLIHWPRTVVAHGPIDVLAASWPCQPHSSAGKRLGEADPRALWPDVARAIAQTRPAAFFGENVARITSNGELRRVVRSLADLGYVGAWRVLNATDVHAPHKRARCFVVAVDAAACSGGKLVRDEPRRAGRSGRPSSGVAGHDGATGPPGLTLLPTPTTRNGVGIDRRGKRANAGGCGPDLQTAVASAVMLLPPPTHRDATRGAGWGDLPGRPPSETTHRVTVSWGAYAEAVARWGCAFDREAPAPTQAGRNDKPQLSAAFVEWMMGLPQGWVCDASDLAPRTNGHRNAALSLLGDGVVPQQGAAAFTFLLGHLSERLAVAA